MDEITRNLNSFRMDHDYTPLTSPRRPDPPDEEVSEIDELAQTLSILEGSNSSQASPQVPSISPVKVVKTTGIKTQKKLLTLNTQLANKNRIKQLQSTPVFKQPNKTAVVKTKPPKPKPPVEEEQEEDHFSDEDFIMESEESEDDANDSDFDIDDALKSKFIKKTNRSRAKVTHDQSLDSPKSVKTPVKTIKTIPPKTSVPPKVEPEPSKVEKPLEPITENKAAEKKPIPKKEKKTPKPIPDDFALFSTPDIIRRVGGKQDSVVTPTTPNTPESPKSTKPAKIFSTPIKTGGERNSVDSKEKRFSTDKVSVTEKDNAVKQSMHRLSLSSETKSKEKRLNVDEKTRRHSVDVKMNSDKLGDPKKAHLASLSTTGSNKTENHVTVQSLEESSGVYHIGGGLVCLHSLNYYLKNLF